MDNSLKFDGSEFAGQDVASLPDTPNEAGFTAQELKVRFDNVGKMLIALGKHNDLVDALTAQTAASGIGAVAADGSTATTVQELIEANASAGNIKAVDSQLGDTTVQTMLNNLKNANSETGARISGLIFVKSQNLNPPEYNALTNEVSLKNGIQWVASQAAGALFDLVNPVTVYNDDGEEIGVIAPRPYEKLVWIVRRLEERIDARKTEIAALQSDKADAADVLTKDNNEAYTPTGDYNPATKKYVDDTVTAIGAGDMRKAAYDTTNTGNKVDTARNAERLGGELPAYYAPASALAAKQDALTFDAAPVSGSANPVTSGGVYTAVAAVRRTVDRSTVTASLTLGAESAGKWYNLNAGVATVTIPANVLPTGSQVQFHLNNASPVTFAAGDGVSLYAADGDLTISKLHDVKRLVNYGVNAWVLCGGTAT